VVESLDRLTVVWVLMRCGDLSFMKVSRTAVRAYMSWRSVEARLGLDGLFGLGGDVMGGVGWLIVTGDALHAVFKPFETFTKTLAELGQLLAAEENEHYDCDDNEVSWCK
jgi:hypothetical protein